MRLLIFLAALLPGLEARAEYDESRRRWTLRNGAVEAAFQLTEEGWFRFAGFSVPNGDSWRPLGSPVQLEIDGKVYGPRTSFTLVSHSAAAIARQGIRQTITLEDSEGRGRVQFDAEIYEGQPVVRTAYRFRNLGGKPVRMTGTDMLPLRLAAGNRVFRAFRVNQWAGGGLYGNFETTSERLEPNVEFTVYSGAAAAQCGWLAFRDAANRGLFAGWEFDGRALAILEHRPAEQALDLSVTIRDLNREVPPNQEFRVPAAFLGSFRGDWDEASHRTQRFVEAAVAHPMHGITYPFPPRYSDRYMGDESLNPYVTRSYMFGGPWIFMNRLAAMKPADLQFAAAEARLYKALRQRIRNGRVYHLASRPAAGAFDGLQSQDPETDTSLIFAYRTAAPAAFRMYRPRGLQPGRTYLVRFQDSSQILTAYGSQLMTDGVRVDLPDLYDAEIVYIEPAP